MTRKKITLKCGSSRTIQKPAELTNINDIVARSQRTGRLTDPQAINEHRQASYGDFSSGLDFEETQLRIASATESFMSLPAEIREQFDNNPKEYLDAIVDPDPETIEALEEIGLQSVHSKAELAPTNEEPPKEDTILAEPVPQPPKAEPLAENS